MASKIKGLQQWCQRMTDGYRDVYVKDFTTSWRNGLAFCAIIHRFRPDLIDYDSLSKENVFDNNHLAFTVAEQELDIPAFLEAADMVALKTPDKLSVITYVSQYYNKLSPLPQLGGPGVQGKKSTPAVPAHGTKRHQPAEPLSEPEPKKQPPAKKVEVDEKSSKVKTLGDKCAICNNKVYLLERHVEEGKLYHRSCFRHSDLSPTNKVYTQSPFLSPSLHSKESSGGSLGKSRAVSPSAGKGSSSGVGRNYGQEDKHGVKRHAEDVGNKDSGKKSEPRKFLFPRDLDTNHSHKPGESKPSTRDAGAGKDISKDKQAQSDHLSLTPRVESHTNSQQVSAPLAGGQASQSHSSMDFLSAVEEAQDVKSPKRQLPLIFQAAGSSDDSASDKTKSGAGDKQEGSSKSSDLSTKQAETRVDSVTPGKKLNEKSSGSILTGSSSKSVSDDTVTGKHLKHHTQTEKLASVSKGTGKSSAPLAKPRHGGTKVLPSASELKQNSEILPSRPKASPRTSIPSTESGVKGDPAKSPSAHRKLPSRAKSPAREPSPPPLPSSAPPPLPQSPPCASDPLSPRHLPTPSSPRPTPRKVSTPVATKQDVASRNKSSVPDLNLQNNDGGQCKSSQFITLSGTSNSSSSAGSKTKNGLSVFSSEAGGDSGSRHEEPMDVETAFSKARAQHGEEPVAVMVVPQNPEQEDKTALTGLLKSLAQVRTAHPTTSVSTTITLSSQTTAQSSGSDHKSAVNVKKSASSQPDGSVGESAGTASLSVLKTAETQKKTPLPSSKLGETVTLTLSTDKAGDNASKPVSILSEQKQNEKSAERVALYKKKADSSVANRRDRSRDSPRETASKDVSLNAAGMKKEHPKSAADLLNEKTLSTAKQSTTSKDSSQPPPFTQVKLRETNTGESTGMKKEHPKSAADLLNEKTLSTAKQSTTNKDSSQPPPFTQVKLRDTNTGESTGMKKERPKSAADVLGGRGLSTPKQSTTSSDLSRPPMFTQVKLRESGNSTLERNERAKSLGNIFESCADSKPSWQQEAERKMAIYRDNGFVDPETKKAVGKSGETKKTTDSSAGLMEDDSAGKLAKGHNRGPPPRPPPVQTGVSHPWQREGKVRPAMPADSSKKSEVSVNVSSVVSQGSSTPGSQQPTSGISASNLKKKEEKTPFTRHPKGILKNENKDTVETTETPPPVRPERRSQREKKHQAEVKTIPEITRTSEAAALPKQAEVSGTKKKIAVGGLKVNLDASHKSSPPSSPVRTPPARPPPPSPTPQGRKKISVDIDFDFNMSSSLDASDESRSQTLEKATPPARPPPPHRTSMSPGRLSAIELQQQLLEIDCKLSELELRGRHLEDSIRSVAAEEEDEDLMMEWFQLVTEKNELVRKECDLVYISREQNLEDEQSQIESQLHYLLSKDEHDKSMEEKEEEEYLIMRKVEIVNQRNTIVESIDEDRLRYEEEDRDIAQMLQHKGFRKDGGTPPAKDKSPGETRVGSSKFYT